MGNDLSKPNMTGKGFRILYENKFLNSIKKNKIKYIIVSIFQAHYKIRNVIPVFSIQCIGDGETQIIHRDRNMIALFLHEGHRF